MHAEGLSVTNCSGTLIDRVVDWLDGALVSKTAFDDGFVSVYQQFTSST